MKLVDIYDKLQKSFETDSPRDHAFFWSGVKQRLIIAIIWAKQMFVRVDIV